MDSDGAANKPRPDPWALYSADEHLHFSRRPRATGGYRADAHPRSTCGVRELRTLARAKDSDKGAKAAALSNDPTGPPASSSPATALSGPPTLAAVAAQAIVDFRRTGISPPGPTTPATREAAPPLPPAPQRGDPAAMDQTTPAAGAPPAPTPTPQPGTQRWAGPPSRALSARGPRVAPDDTEVVQGLHTAQDVIALLSTKACAVRFVYLNRAPNPQSFRPYDLRVVPSGGQDAEYFVISSTGVVHIHPNQPSEVIPLAQWMRESTLFDVLTSIRFFRRFLVLKAFVQWRRNVRFKLYCLTRRRLCQRFVFAHKTFAQTCRALFRDAYELRTVPLLHVPELKAELTLERFRELQGQQRAAAAQHFAIVMERMETKLVALCAEVSRRAEVPDFATVEGLQGYLLAAVAKRKDHGRREKRAKSMTAAKQENRQRMSELKRDMVECEMLGAIIRLVDYVAVEQLFHSHLRTLAEFLALLRLPPEKKTITFQVTIAFGAESSLPFIPSEAEVLDCYAELCEHLVALAAQVTRLICLKSLKSHFLAPPRMVSLAHALRQDWRHARLRGETQALIRADFAEVAVHSRSYEAYRMWAVYVEREWPLEWQRWQGLKPTELKPGDFTTHLRKVKASFQQLEKMFNKALGVLYLNTQKLRAELLPAIQAITATVKAKLVEVARLKCQRLHHEYTTRIKALAERPAVLRTFAAFVQALNEVAQAQPLLQTEGEEIEQLYLIAEEHSVEVPGPDIVQKDMLLGGTAVTQKCLRDTFRDAVRAAEEFRTANVAGMATQLEGTVEQLNEELLSMLAVLDGRDFTNSAIDCHEVLEQLAELQENIAAIRQKVDLFVDFQRLFNMPTAEWANLAAVESLWQKRHDLWSTLARWHERTQHWGSTPLDQLDVQQVKEEMLEFHRKAVQLHRAIPDDVTEYLLELVREERQALPLILHLGNKALRREHWARIFHAMQKPYVPDTSYTLDGLRMWKIFEHEALVEEQSMIATGEQNLQATVAQIQTVWDKTTIRLKKLEPDIVILENVVELLDLIRDHQATVHDCLRSQYAAAIRPALEEWDRRLQTAAAVLEEWGGAEERWRQFDCVFAVDEMRRQLPDENRKFVGVDKWMREFLKKVEVVKDVMEVCNEGVLESFRSASGSLDDLQGRVSVYLDRKRDAFPRFYFLSNAALLQVISHPRRPAVLQAVLRPCFAALHALVPRVEGASDAVVGLRAAAGEALPLPAPVAVRGAVEAWLAQLVAAMQASVLGQTQACWQARSGTAAADLCLTFPPQCVQVAEELQFAAEGDKLLETAHLGVAAWQALHDTHADRMAAICARLGGPEALTSPHRATLASLLLVHARLRDTARQLVAAGDPAAQRFEWALRPRYYLEGGGLVVRSGGGAAPYGGEWLGAAPRAVATPLLERARVTALGALAANQGCVVQGPPAVGKAESLREVALALGRHCIVLSCTEVVNYQLLGQLLRGASSAGACLCFIHLHLLPAPLLSVLGHHLSQIAAALAARQRLLSFEGHDLLLDPKAAVLASVTLEAVPECCPPLPPRLQALFRPAAIAVPEVACVAEALLAACGLTTAPVLGSRLAQFLRMVAPESAGPGTNGLQLLRAVVAALQRGAGGGEVAGVGSPAEGQRLVRATREALELAVAPEEAPLAFGLLADIFSDVEPGRPQPQPIEATLRQHFVDHGLTPEAGAVLCVTRLCTALDRSPGAILLGPTASGKSACWQVAWRASHPAGAAAAAPLVLYPNALTATDLYGGVPAEGRWADGLLAQALRTAGLAEEGAASPAWVVLDGALRACWVDGLCPALDGSRLALPSGEQLPPAPGLRLLFETVTLDDASPALVGRCAHVVLPGGVDAVWPSAAARVSERLAGQHSTRLEAETLARWLQTWFGPLLPLVAAQCRLVTPLAGAAVLESFAGLLGGLLASLDAAGEGPEDISDEGSAAEEEDESSGAGDSDEPDTPLRSARTETLAFSHSVVPNLNLAAVEADPETLFHMYAAFALIWTVGSLVLNDDRAKFDTLVREIFAKHQRPFPDKRSVFDYCVQPLTLQWVPWPLRPFEFRPEVLVADFFVATPATAPLVLLAPLALTAGRPALVLGAAGAGKSHTLRAIVGELASVGQLARQDAMDIGVTAVTTGQTLQHRLEDRFQRCTSAAYGPAPGQALLCVVDDLHLATAAPSALDLLRQLLEMRRLLDREAHALKAVEGVQWLGAARRWTPAHTSAELDRLAAKFTILSLGDTTEPTLFHVARGVLRAYFSCFDSEVVTLVPKLAQATAKLCLATAAHFRPSLAQPHYIFGLRDVARVVQGMLFVTPETCPGPEVATALWVHECSRVFHDRLCDAEDRAWWWAELERVLADHVGAVESEGHRGKLFGGLPSNEPAMEEEEGRRAEDLPYGLFPDPDQLRGKVLEFVMAFNDSTNREDRLGVWDTLVRHLTALGRLLRLAPGHALLAGPPGAGRLTLVQLAAFIHDAKLHCLSLVPTYALPEWRGDLKRAMLEAGCSDEVVFLFLRDTQLVHDDILEDVNGLLRSGEMFGLVGPEDLEPGLPALQAMARAATHQDSWDAVVAAFFQLCRQNLHVVLAADPAGPFWRGAVRQFPALLGNVTVEWYLPWNRDTLMELTRQYLPASPCLPEERCADVHAALLGVHDLAVCLRAEYAAQGGHGGPVLPLAHVEAVRVFARLLEEQSRLLDARVARLQRVVEHLEQTERTMNVLQDDLRSSEPALEGTQARMARLTEAMAVEEAAAEVARRAMRHQEQICQDILEEAQAIHAFLEKELSRAMPAYYVATDGIRTVTRRELDDIRLMGTPPEKVRLTMEAVMVLLREKTTWDNVKRVVADPTFLDRLVGFERDAVPESVSKKLQRWINDDDFQPEVVRKSNVPCMYFCQWIRALDVYTKSSRNLEPKRIQLSDVEERLGEARQLLKLRQEEAGLLDAKVAKSRRALADARGESEVLQLGMKQTTVLVERATRFFSVLGQYSDHWRQQLSEHLAARDVLLGNMVAAAAAVAYAGPLDHEYRERFRVASLAEIARLGLAVDPAWRLPALATPAHLRAWGVRDAPPAAHALENALVAMHTRRWCLLLDPEGHAAGWIKQQNREVGLKVMNPRDANLLRAVEAAVRAGLPVLLEDVGATVEPSLGPLLRKETFTQAGRLFLRLGEGDVDYDPHFNLFLTTRLPQARFAPEVYLFMTIINFEPSAPAVEEQLLTATVRHESEALQQDHDALTQQLADRRGRLQATEEEVLDALAAVTGSVLEDEVALLALDQKASVMSELREAIQEDELRAAEVEEGRQHFLAVARRGLLLRRAVAQTCLTDHMYEVEPEVLRALFGQALELAPASLVPSKRVANLVRFLTAHTYAGMARGLRRPDRVLLAFLVAVAALRAEGAVAPRQWAFFTRGPPGADPELDEAQRPPWLPPARWPWVWQLDGLEGDLGLVDSMINHGKQWQVWLASENRCHLLPPLAKPLTSWQRLLLMRAMGDRMLIKMATIVIGDCLGPVDFDLPMDVAAAFAASGPLSPLLFLLGEGIDVLPFYLEFAKDRGRVEKQDHLCAGEALMAAKAEDLLHQAVRTGRWVFLQNVHLDVALLEVVRKVMQDLTTKEVHPEFRLWLSSVPTQSFPSALARPAIRLVPQWPTGLRAQLQHVAQTTVARDLLDDHALGPQGTRLVLSLVHFQGLCLSRNRAGHMGWAAVYHWAAADFAAAYRCWQPALHRPEGCWAALRAAAVDLVYSGRVPFADDQRCLAALFDKCFPEGPTAGRLPTADVHSPAMQPQGSALQELLGMFPGEEVPEDLGLCDNSMLLMLKAASERLVTGAAGQAAPGGPPPDRYAAAVVDVCDAVLRGLPPAAKGGGRRRGSRPAEAASPLLDVLLQLEVATFNAALAQVQQSAMHLRDAVHQSGCSADMMETCDSLYQHRVPRCWHQHGYPGWMPLGQWLGHLRACGEALQRWLDAGPPDRFWVPGFAAPLRLFAVALQAYAQRTGLPVGDLRFRVEGSCSVARTPPVLRVDGLRLYGASWDAASNSVTEQKSGTLYAPVPTLQLLPVVPETASPDLDHEEVYPCPLYYTAPARLPRPPVSPALACVELPTPLYEPGRWALRRVQLLCHAPAEAEAEGAAEDAAWLRPPPPDPAGDSPSPAPA